jgi:hypothetical protein
MGAFQRSGGERGAAVSRPELHVTTPTMKAIEFHDLRATGVTWAIVRGDGFEKVMQRAGHEDVSTTQIYQRTAENLSDAFGDVFPPLPVLNRPESPRGASELTVRPKTRWNAVGAAGLEPATSSV